MRMGGKCELLAALVLLMSTTACLATLSEQEADELYPDRFAATPVVSTEDGKPVFSQTVSARFQQQMTSRVRGKPKKGHIIVKKATAAAPKGSNKKKKVSSQLDSEGNSIDLSKYHRECPAAKCKKKTRCPMANGVCCSKAGVCCPSGSSCLNTNPPTCIHDGPNDIFKCAEEKCHRDYRCPHKGVVTCCDGGRSCCPQGFRCMAGFPPKCIKLITKAEYQRERRRQKDAAARYHLKKREARGKRFTAQLKGRVRRHQAIRKAHKRMHAHNMRQRHKAFRSLRKAMRKKGKSNRRGMKGIFDKIRKKFGPGGRKGRRRGRRKGRKRKKRKKRRGRRRRRRRRRRHPRRRRRKRKTKRKRKKKKKKRKKRRRRHRRQSRRRSSSRRKGRRRGWRRRF